jgi:DNA-binding transcriptional LysR family regulator
MLSSDDLDFFITVARSRSLAEAARKMNVTAPAVTQRLRALETRLGVRLVDRALRGTTLTDEGKLVLEEGQAIMDQVEMLREQLSDRTKLVRGHLRVAAPYGFGRRHIAPIIDQFARSFAEATVTLHLSETPARMFTENWDIIIHIGELNTQGRLMTTLAPNRRFLVASPAYLHRSLPLRTPADLTGHRCLALDENDENVTLWRFTHAEQGHATIRIEPAMSTNDGEVLKDWALSGQGLAVRSEWDVVEAIAAGTLVHVLPDWHLPDTDIVAFLNTRHNRSKRVSEMLALLRRELKPAPWSRPAP